MSAHCCDTADSGLLHGHHCLHALRSMLKGAKVMSLDHVGLAQHSIIARMHCHGEAHSLHLEDRQLLWLTVAHNHTSA